MKFMNVFLKFTGHADYVAYRNGMLDEAENFLNEGKLEEYKAKKEDVETFDNEYKDFVQQQAEMTALRGAAVVPQGVTDTMSAPDGSMAAVSFENENADDKEYRMAFMNYVLKGEAIPAQFKNQSEVTSSGDVGAVIPNTIIERIVEKMELVGTILNKVTRTFYKGGVTVPTSVAKPVATWTTEHGTSDKQKKALGSITFNYFKLRCVVAVGIATDTMTLEIFEQTLSKNVADAMVKALEEAIIKGDGLNEPKGILTESAQEDQVVSLKKGAAITYKNLCAMEAALPEAYENGAEWYMSKNTFYNQIVGMTDSNGQPIARTNVGIDGRPEHTILGRKVNFCQYVPSWTASVEEDITIAFIFNMEDYMLNTNLNVTAKKYEDHDTDDQMTKAIMLADGKVIDTNSLTIMQVKNA